MAGRVSTWGQAANGESARGFAGEGNKYPTPEPVPLASDVAEIVAGEAQTIVRKTDGTVWVAGSSTFGATGQGDHYERQYLTQVPGLTGIVKVAAHGTTIFALTSSGEVVTWGGNLAGSMGVGSKNGRWSALCKVETAPGVILKNVVLLSAGHNAAFFVKSDGTLWRSGTMDQRGEYVYATLDPSWSTSIGTITALEGSRQHLTILLSTGKVKKLGRNQYGQQGVGYLNQDPGKTVLASASIVHSPVGEIATKTIVAVAQAEYHWLALDSEGNVWACGRNNHGQCGQPLTTTTISTPTKVPGLTGVAKIAAGGSEESGGANGTQWSMVLKTDGTVWTWGGNQDGELGQGGPLWPGNENQYVPAQIAPLPSGSMTDIDQIACSAAHGIIHHTTGTPPSAGPVVLTPTSGGIKVDWTPVTGDLVSSWTVEWRRVEHNPYNGESIEGHSQSVQEPWNSVASSINIAATTTTYTITGLPEAGGWPTNGAAQKLPASAVYEVVVKANYTQAEPSPTVTKTGAFTYDAEWPDEHGPQDLATKQQEPLWRVTWRRKGTVSGKHEPFHEAELPRGTTSLTGLTIPAEWEGLTNDEIEVFVEGKFEPIWGCTSTTIPSAGRRVAAFSVPNAVASIPFPKKAPKIQEPTGYPKQGDKLKVTRGDYYQEGAVSARRFQWYTQDHQESAAVPITGATGEEFTPTAAQVGLALMVWEWVTNAQGETNEPNKSEPSRVIAAGEEAPPEEEPPVEEEHEESEGEATPVPPRGGTVDVTVRLQALDGAWETCGADRAISVRPETVTLSSNEWGPDKASFELHRSPIAIWPDIGAFTPVEIEIGGVLVWEGRTIETPVRSGADQVINVQCQGWQYHLDDDVYQRCYVHSKLTDWKDNRSFLTQLLTTFVTAPSVGSQQGAITLGWGAGTTVANGNSVGVTLDLGPASTAKRVVIELDKGTVTDPEIRLYVRGSNSEALQSPLSQPIENVTVSTGGGIYAGTFSLRCRYVSIFLYYAGGGGTSSEQTCRIKKAYVFAETAYESGNASILKASTIATDALASGTILLSSDLSQIQATSFNIPDFVLAKASTPRETIEAANAYHNWITQLLPGRRVSFRPRPTDPLLEIGTWAGSDIEDTSANNGAEVYNRALVEATSAANTPLIVERSAGQQSGTALLPVASPAPDNPSFATNTTSWSIEGEGSIIRDLTTFHSAPAAGRWEPASAYQRLVETFTGTFQAGVQYALSFWMKAPTGSQVLAALGVPNDTGGATLTAASEGWTQYTITWTPKSARTGVTLLLVTVDNFAGAGKGYIDDLALSAAKPTLVDRRGFRRTKVIQMSSAITAAEGNQIADVFLQGHMTTPFKGSAQVQPGGVRTVLGGQLVHPSLLLLRTQELLRLSHLVDPDTGGVGRDGTIAEVSYTHRDQRAQVTLDDKRANFDALLARLQVVQTVGS